MTTYRINGEVVSNANGKFEFIPGTAGLIRVNFESSEFGSASLTVRLEPGKMVVLHDVVLTPPITLKGRVVDEVTGKGVSGAGIRIAHTSRETDSTLLFAPTESDPQAGDDGSFIIEQVARGEVFWVTHPVLARAQFVTSDPGDELTVRLRRFGTISGRLLDADGRASENDFVSAYGLVESHSIVAADGTFDLGAFEPGTYTLTARIYRNGRFKEIPPRSIEVDGYKPATLELREPIGGTTVKVEARDSSGEILTPIALLLPGNVPTPRTIGELTRVTRDAYNDWQSGEGSVIDHVPPGRYTLLLVGELTGAAVVHRKELVVQSSREQKVEVVIASQPQLLPFGLGDEMPFFLYHSGLE